MRAREPNVLWSSELLCSPADQRVGAVVVREQPPSWEQAARRAPASRRGQRAAGSILNCRRPELEGRQSAQQQRLAVAPAGRSSSSARDRRKGTAHPSALRVRGRCGVSDIAQAVFSGRQGPSPQTPTAERPPGPAPRPTASTNGRLKGFHDLWTVRVRYSVRSLCKGHRGAARARMRLVGEGAAGVAASRTSAAI